jgi:hypothetical protein
MDNNVNLNNFGEYEGYGAFSTHSICVTESSNYINDYSKKFLDISGSMFSRFKKIKKHNLTYKAKPPIKKYKVEKLGGIRGIILSNFYINSLKINYNRKFHSSRLLMDAGSPFNYRPDKVIETPANEDSNNVPQSNTSSFDNSEIVSPVNNCEFSFPDIISTDNYLGRFMSPEFWFNRHKPFNYNPFQNLRNSRSESIDNCYKDISTSTTNESKNLITNDNSLFPYNENVEKLWSDSLFESLFEHAYSYLNTYSDLFQGLLANTDNLKIFKLFIIYCFLNFINEFFHSKNEPDNRKSKLLHISNNSKFNLPLVKSKCYKYQADFNKTNFNFPKTVSINPNVITGSVRVFNIYNTNIYNNENSNEYSELMILIFNFISNVEDYMKLNLVIKLILNTYEKGSLSQEELKEIIYKLEDKFPNRSGLSVKNPINKYEEELYEEKVQKLSENIRLGDKDTVLASFSEAFSIYKEGIMPDNEIIEMLGNLLDRIEENSTFESHLGVDIIEILRSHDIGEPERFIITDRENGTDNFNNLSISEDSEGLEIIIYDEEGKGKSKAQIIRKDYN